MLRRLEPLFRIRDSRFGNLTAIDFEFRHWNSFKQDTSVGNIVQKQVAQSSRLLCQLGRVEHHHVNTRRLEEKVRCELFERFCLLRRCTIVDEKQVNVRIRARLAVNLGSVQNQTFQFAVGKESAQTRADASNRPPLPLVQTPACWRRLTPDAP